VHMEFKCNTDVITQSLNMLDLGLLSLEWMFRLLQAELRRTGWVDGGGDIKGGRWGIKRD